MPRVTAGELLEQIADHLGAMQGVFSTPQWGGRAYKLPGPGGNRRKPKLLAFVVATDDGAAVSVSFKLTRERAEACVESCPGLEPHSFATLGGSGWLSARVSSRRRLATLKKLLAESRQLYPPAATAADEESGETKTPDPFTRRIDRVMAEAREKGWRPNAPE